MLRCALIGCGGMARGHAEQLLAIDGVEVVALCDPIKTHTALFKEKFFPEAAEFDSFDRLLDDDALNLDAVVLVTPHTVHYPHAKAALQRGLHVLVEKPMVTQVDHAYDLWRESTRQGKLLAIAFQAPYSAEFGYLAQMRDRGEWGTVHVVSASTSQSWYDLTLNTWRQDPALSGGGFMYDTGAHLLNAIVWLMNEPVVEVSCQIDNMGCPVDINGVATLRFQNGALASVGFAGNVPQFSTLIRVMTDRLLIDVEQYGGGLTIKSRAGTLYPHVQQDLDTPAAGTPHRNFVRAIRGEEPLRAPARYGVLLSALMDAMYESAQKRHPVQVRPVPETID